MSVLLLILGGRRFAEDKVDSRFHSSFLSKKIIKTKNTNRRRPRRSAGAKAAATGAKQTTAVAAAAKAAKSKLPPPAVTQIAEKIIVSNLPVDVNEAQLRVSHTPFLLSTVAHSTLGTLRDDCWARTQHQPPLRRWR